MTGGREDGGRKGKQGEEAWGGRRFYCILDAGYTYVYTETEVTLVLLLIPVHNAHGE